MTINKSFIWTLGISLILSLASLAGYHFDKSFNYRWLVLAGWLISCFLPLILWLKPKFKSLLANLLKFTLSEKLFLLSLVLLSSVLRFINLSSIPVPHGDEMRDTGLMPISIISGLQKDFFNYSGSIGQFFYVVSTIPHLLFGDTVFAARFNTALIGVLTIVVFYFFVRKFFHRRLAVISAILFCFYHVHLFFSRTEFLNNLDPFLAVLLSFSFLTIKRGSLPSYFIMGLISGFSLHFFTGIRAFDFSLLAFTILPEIFLFFKNIFVNKKVIYLPLISIFILLIGFTIGLGPTILNLKSPDFIASGGGHFLIGKPFLEWNLTDFKTTAIRYLNSLGAYVFLPIDFHYRWGGSFLTFPQNFFFLLGSFICFFRIRQKKYFLLGLMLLVTPFVNSALVDDLNFTHRLLSVLPAMILISALGIEALAKLIPPKRYRRVITGLLILIIVFQNLKLFFLDQVWKKSIDNSTQVSSLSAMAVKDLPSDIQLYFLSDINLNSRSIPSLKYILGNRSVIDVIENDNLSSLKIPFALIVPSWKYSEHNFREEIQSSKIEIKVYYNWEGGPLFYLFTGR